MIIQTSKTKPHNHTYIFYFYHPKLELILSNSKYAKIVLNKFKKFYVIVYKYF